MSDLIVAINQELRRRGPEAHRSLLRLLSHPDPAVRGWAGCHALEFAPKEAEQTLEEVARTNNETPIAMYSRIIRDGGAGIVCHAMKEDDIKAFYQQPWVAVASDGGNPSTTPSVDCPHSSVPLGQAQAPASQVWVDTHA